MSEIIAASGEPLPEPQAARLRAELQPGEVLLWTGRPIAALAARPMWIFSLVGGAMMIPMVIISLVFLLVISVVIIATKAWCFGLFLIPFFGMLLLILGILIAMPLLSRRAANNTIYALTDRRAIIWQQGPFAMHVQSFTREQLGTLQRNERPDGTGDLIFDQTYWHDSHGHHHARAVGFTSIARVREVEELIRALLARPQDAPPS